MIGVSKMNKEELCEHNEKIQKLVEDLMADKADELCELSKNAHDIAIQAFNQLNSFVLSKVKDKPFSGFTYDMVLREFTHYLHCCFYMLNIKKGMSKKEMVSIFEENLDAIEEDAIQMTIKETQ